MLKAARPRATTSLDQEEPTVFLVTADSALSRRAVAAVKPHKRRLMQHGSAREFFNACPPKQPGALVWDLAIPGPSDVDLLDQLARRTIHLPVIFLADSAEAAAIVRAMKAGAMNYLVKPVARDALREAIGEALAWDAENRERLRRVERINGRLRQLTVGETEVMQLLLRGRSNREIADSLELSVRTIEVRRAKLMKKMRARSLPELVRLAIAVEEPQ